MKFAYTFLIALFLAVTSYGQSVTEVFMPLYIQNTQAAPGKTPYVCRLTINGLDANKTYRYFNRLVPEADTAASLTTTGSGYYILVNSTTGAFRRVIANPVFTVADRYETFTTDASGSYTGWFMSELLHNLSTHVPGNKYFLKIYVNDGGTGTTVAKRMTAPSSITIITFGTTTWNATATTTPNSTAIRSTAAAAGVDKNIVMLYDNAAGTGRPIAGTLIEADGVAQTISNYYAAFYGDHVNETSKTWGASIPNNLANGIRRISQYSLTTGAEVGYKVSGNGSWAKEGGGTVSTVNTAGGITDVIVLDGSIVKLDVPVLLPQSIDFAELPVKAYGDPDYPTNASASSHLPIRYTSSNPAVAVVINGNIHITGAGTTDITAEQAGDEDYQAGIPVTRRLTVQKAPLTVTAPDVTILQDDPIPVFTVNYTGFVYSENVNNLVSAATAAATVTQSNVPGTYTITPGGAASDNYSFNYINGVLTITPAQQQQTILFNSLPAKTYGNPDFSAGASVSSGLSLSYSSSNSSVATIDNAGLIHITGVGTTTITVSQGGNNAFFPATPVSLPLTVNPATLTITAENQSRLVGQPNPVLTVRYSGFVYGQNSTVLTTPPVAGTTAVIASPVGDYPITVSGAAAANYTISYTSGVLTVLPLPSQAITFDPLPVKRYGNADFTLGATASSGLAVVYTSSNPLVATVTNNIVHITGAGTATITAAQPGDPFHAAALSVTHVLTVQKANLAIGAVDTSKQEGQPNPVLAVRYTGFVNGDDAGDLTTQPVIVTTAVASSLLGTYPITVSAAASPNYNIAFTDGILTVLPSNGVNQDEVSAYLSAPGRLRVNYHAITVEKVSVQLFDSYGNRLLDSKLWANKGVNTWYFEVGNMASGVYPVRVTGKDVSVKTKVIIR